MNNAAKGGATVIDEMFPDATGCMMELDEPLGSSAMNMDLANTDKIVHTDFYNNFDDIFDEDDFS